MQGVPDEIKHRQIALFAICDASYGAGVIKALKRGLPGNDDLGKGISGADTLEIA